MAAKPKCCPRLHHRHFLGFQGQKYLVLKQCLKGAAAKIGQEGTPERGPEVGSGGVKFGQKGSKIDRIC